MKYISADYIKAIMKGDRLLQGNCEYELWKQEVDKKVDAMPSIEVMDVVTAYQQGWCDALDASINALNDAKFQLAKADRKTEPTISKMEQVDEPQTEDFKACVEGLTLLWIYNYVTDDEFHRIDARLKCKGEPQTDNLFTDKDGDVWEWRGDAWYCISGDEPQTERPSCETCKWDSEEWDGEHCDSCVAHIDKPSNYEPQTDCAWK